MTFLRRLIREICGMPTDDLDDALATAQLAHFGQTRRTGEPYIEHPKEVARIVYRYYRDQDLCAAALLHDALEDAPYYGTVQSAEEMASLIAASFNDPEIGQEALRIVNRLTHNKEELPYHAYVLTLLDDPDALKIKLSDMLHNLQSSPSDNQKLKYAQALEALQIAAGGIPGGIDSGHWKALQRAAGLVIQSESMLRKFIRILLMEKNVIATGMCFPFAYQKAEEWFEDHFTKGGPGRAPKRHPDLNDKSKFKVVHGTVTDRWKKPPKPVVHGWVEMGNLVFDDQTKFTKPDGVKKEFYYDTYQPEIYKEFTAEEALVKCIQYGGEGPWDEDLHTMMQKRDVWRDQ